MSDVAERLWGVVEPYVAAEGIELDDVEVVGNGGGKIVRITVDGPEAIEVARVAELSRGISRLLDEDDPFSGPYTMEVSSPGLERKLRRPRHYEKSIGSVVKVKTRRDLDGSHHHTGKLTGADEDSFVVEVDGVERLIAYEDVTSARTVFVWEKQPKPGKN